MPYATAASYHASGFIVLAIGRRAPFADAAPDTLVFVARDYPNDDSSAAHIAEYVHEIGAMAVIA
jgi:hypothetical protein